MHNISKFKMFPHKQNWERSKRLSRAK